MWNFLQKKRILTVLLSLGLFSLSAQDISVRVQVNRLPDGHYPTKVYQFNNAPGLVTITLTNLSQQPRSIYLTGKLTGDNGVLVATPKNYRPPTNIDLAPFAIKTLNAIEASYLFDVNKLVYLSGNTSIKSSVFGEQGLPEGTYQLCIRAVDATTRQPLSEEEPIGCSNIFLVSTLEPPMILNPYDEEALVRLPVQSVPIRWTTPAGAPPSTEYLLRIVEVFGKRNPYDAILSTSTPFFETVVKGSPLFFYGVQHPQLQEGRTYAMIVVASDPLGGGTFRNNGRSEVVQFTYGAANGVAGGGQGQQTPPGGPALEYADHTLTGRLSWAFKKSEIPPYGLYTGNGITAKPKDTKVLLAGQDQDQTQKLNNIATQTIAASPYLASTVSKSNFATQASVTPLIAYNTVAAVNADNTLQKPASSTSPFSKISQPVNLTPITLPLPDGILSGSGASLTAISYSTVTPDTAAERFAMAGVTVNLQGVTYSGGLHRILLATGKTDGEGLFSLQFLDPAYGSGNGVTRLILSVTGNDFENSEIEVPMSVLGKAATDLGSYTLLAKTLRLFPKLVYDSLLVDGNNGYGWHIYRDVQDLQDRPWLANEGQTGNVKKMPIVVDGRQVIEVGADSVEPSNSTGKSPFGNIQVLDAKGTGRIFFGGNLYIRIIPSSSNYRDVSSTASVVNAPIPSNKILSAKLEYHSVHKPSSVSGAVYFGMGAQGRIPITGSQVRVRYKRKDRAPGIDPNDLFKAVSDPAVKALSATTPGFTDHNVKDPGVTSLELIAYGMTDKGLYSPLMVTAATAGGGSAGAGGSGSGGNQNLKVSAVINPVALQVDLNPLPDEEKGITTTADELGNYSILLPPLIKGAVIIVEVLNTPSDFRNFAIEAQGYPDSKASIAMDAGASAHVDFSIKGDIADVVGRVVDDQGKPLANARIDFKGSTLGATGPDGIFQFSIYPGNHVLTLEKEGYVAKNVTINVPQLTGGGTNDGYASKWMGLSLADKQKETLTRIGQSQTVQASVAKGNTFTAAMFGIAAPGGAAGGAGAPASGAVPANGAPGGVPKSGAAGSATQLVNNNLAYAFGVAAASPGSPYAVPREFALDLKDIGYLNKIVGKARFRVLEDGTNNPIAGAQITVFDSTHVTDDKGEWYYEGFGGSATLTLLPPAGTQYVAVQKLMTLTESGIEMVIVITMQKGILISGTVSANGQPLPNARILLDGQDFSGISTDASGHYSLYTLAGPHTLGARKQGYVGSDADPGGITSNKTIDFKLKGGGDKNYSKLLGFAIELDEADAAGEGQEKWSGNFVQLQAVDKNVFGLAGTTRIPFSDVVVSFDRSGNAQPQNNVVKTDVTELPLKLFGYLPAKLTRGVDVLTITGGSDGKGQLSGNIVIAFDAIQGYRGWSTGDAKVMLTRTGAKAVGDFVLFSSGAAPTTDQTYGLLAAGNEMSGQLYGFAVGLGAAVVNNDGLEFSGVISTPNAAPIESINLHINKLAINRALTVSAVLLQTDDIPVLKIASWRATIQNLIFNEDGFKIGGNVAINIPKSTASSLNFTNLSIAKTGMFGGSFDIPDGGINVLMMAAINSNRNPLTFGKVGTSNVYRLAGKASFKLDIEILSVPLELPAFEILTNGDFTITAPADYTFPLGPFNFSLTNLIVNGKDNTPSIVLQGKFKADFSFLKFDVGEINIRPAGGGPVFTVNKVGVTLDVPVVKASVMLGFNKDGFEGEGGLDIPGSLIGGKVAFHYYKHPGGIDLGASFFANIPPVPIGGLVTLEGIGGGFRYVSGDPTNGGFSVDVQGKISLVASGTFAALNPVGIHVESAGVLKGYGDFEVASYFKHGHAEVVFNGPERTFTVQVNQDMSPLEGLAKETVQGTFLLSAKKDDEFAFLGCATQMKLLSLIDNHGEMAIAVNLKNPKTREDLVSHYFEYAPDSYVQARFSGVYLGVESHVGVSEDDGLGFDLFVVSAKAWFEYGYHASLLLNFSENAYRIAFGGGFDLGIEACVAKIACVNLSASMCINVEGGYNNELGWNFQASAAGDASLGFGLGIGDCDPGCNEVVSFWDGCVGGAFKVCGNASVNLGFNKQDGLKFSAHAGGTRSPCF